MDQTFHGKVALVTGSSSGIGESVVRKLAERGADVVVHYARASAEAEAVAQAIRKGGTRAMVVGADLGDRRAAKGLVDIVADQFGKIDILVNNAGEWHAAPVADITMEDVQRQFQVSTFAILEMVQHALPHMPSEGGAIVNVISNIAVDPTATTAIYAASRAATAAMTASFAQELGGRRITVNAVAPGPTETKMSLVRATKARVEYVQERTPFGRYGRPEDIAGVIVFLASPEGCWINGQTLLVDGGYTRGVR